mgnify:CR=1 FL=1
MQSNATTPVLAAALLLMASCDKSDTEKKTDAKTEAAVEAKADAKADAPPKNEGPFAAFDLADVKSKWQGAWLVDRGYVAWHVDGDKVTVFDGKAEKTLEFEVQAPCQVAVVERSDSGSSSTIHKFAFDGDTLYAGLGNAGAKKGEAIAACVSNKVYTLQDGKCLAWKQSMFDNGRWESSDATCTLSEGDPQTFEVEGTTLEVVGEALVDTQMKANVAAHKTSFDEAKAGLG